MTNPFTKIKIIKHINVLVMKSALLNGTVIWLPGRQAKIILEMLIRTTIFEVFARFLSCNLKNSSESFICGNEGSVLTVKNKPVSRRGQ